MKFAGTVGVKVAVSECVATESAAVLRVAIPETTEAEPSEVAPSKYWTVPTAVLGVSVAFIATVVPAVTGLEGVTERTVVVVVGGATVIVYGTAVEVDGVNSAGFVGVNVAVRECVPTASVVTALAAIPPETATGPGIAVAPSKNCTLPTALLGGTVEVRVTVEPDTAGLAGVAARAVVVTVAGTDVTVYETAAEVDPVKFAALVGMNFAVSECVATVNALVVRLAVPPETVAAAPRFAAPSRNCTVPTAELGVIVAVRVLDVPTTTGLAGVTTSAVVVVTAAELTTYETAADVELVKAVLSVGVNFAVSEWVAAVRAVDVNVATPAATLAGAPKVAAPSKNCTVPAAAGDTVALSCAEVPAVTGLAGVTARAVVVVVGTDGTGYTWVHVVPVTRIDVDT